MMLNGSVIVMPPIVTACSLKTFDEADRQIAEDSFHGGP